MNSHGIFYAVVKLPYLLIFPPFNAKIFVQEEAVKLKRDQDIQWSCLTNFFVNLN